MRLKSIELNGFKSFGKKTVLEFGSAITAIVGPNGSGKSNVAEAFRFVLGEQSMKSLRGKRGEDLIFNGGKTAPRAGRASVSLVFSNKPKLFNLDFDEVMLGRTVHRDGVNDYSLNGSMVRLKDIVEMLAQANIGSSGHHIISQGEADRILSAGNLERREMIEDALGLKAYIYKREEAEKKLEKTGENIKQVESLRREIAPHLKFLGGQVKKIEEARALREKLADAYREYLKRESIYLEHEGADIAAAKEGPLHEKRMLEERMKVLRHELEISKTADGKTRELIDLERALTEARRAREDASRELGRVEGGLRALRRSEEMLGKREGGTVPYASVVEFTERLEREFESAQGLSALEMLRERIRKLLGDVRSFMASLRQGDSSIQDLAAEIQALEGERAQFEAAFADAKAQEESLLSRVAALRTRIEETKEASRDSERELFQAMARRGELEAELSKILGREELLARAHDEFKREQQEGAVLVGRVVTEFAAYEVRDDLGGALSIVDILGEEREQQEKRRKALEKMKIRLEEAGIGSSDDILKEHREVTERDAFLAREITDLETSIASLQSLIADLVETLEKKFDEGIQKVNLEFDAFFKIMFGGGGAELKITKERKRSRFAGLESEDGEQSEGDDEDVQEGIEISVHLPHKRLRGLHMLSGGERALTSIALIFAMSQVNPPPFIILDETDAALDEANSRRYGDMIENLSKKSQLILITHNRETMSRAGIIYGVTMAGDGISKLLSVKFEEAVAVAK